jgi:hypothetical protein
LAQQSGRELTPAVPATGENDGENSAPCHTSEILFDPCFGPQPVISENSGSRSYHDSHGADLGCIVNSPWWRGFGDLAKRSDKSGQRSTSAQSMAAGRIKAWAKPKRRSARVGGYAATRS